MLGAGAWYTWYQNQEQARQSAIQYASTLDEVVEKAKAMSEIQIRGSIADSGESIDALKDKLEDLRMLKPRPLLKFRNIRLSLDKWAFRMIKIMVTYRTLLNISGNIIKYPEILLILHLN
jgi:hypothetical protein